MYVRIVEYCILLLADDMVFFCDTTENLQYLLSEPF